MKHFRIRLGKQAVAVSLAMLCFSTCVGGTSAAAGNDAKVWVDGCPVIGEFVSDPEIEALIAEKEAALEKAGNQTRVASKNLAIPQEPQETNYWCGYAAIQSLLAFENILHSQTVIAAAVYSTGSACPWYLTNGNSTSQFPAAVYLTNEISGFSYVPFPYGAAGANPPSASDLKSRITGTINSTHGVLACGTSKASSGNASHLPDYPNSNIGHWIVVKGYYNYGDNMYIADPAKSSAVSWSGNIQAYYSVLTTKLQAFVAPKGIIW